MVEIELVPNLFKLFFLIKKLEITSNFVVVWALHQKCACFKIYIESEYSWALAKFIDFTQKNTNSCKKVLGTSASFSEVSFLFNVASVAVIYCTEGKQTWTAWVLLFTLKFPVENSTTAAADQLPKTEILDFMDTIKWVWWFPKAWCSTFFL